MWVRRFLPRAACLGVVLLWVSAQRAVSQAADGKQALVVGYPTQGIQIGGGTNYKGVIYVRVFPAGALDGATKANPVATAELGPSQRDIVSLPLGEYEVHFQMRTGSELKTFILRNVILRAERASNLVVEMNGDAKTTIIGGDMTAQQMADTLRQLQSELAATKRELAEVKRR